MTSPQPPLNIEDNKVVRRARAGGCTCTWVWVGDDMDGTNPAPLLPYDQGCAYPPHTVIE
jgi:hypothetical protein